MDSWIRSRLKTLSQSGALGHREGEPVENMREVKPQATKDDKSHTFMVIGSSKSPRGAGPRLHALH